MQAILKRHGRWSLRNAPAGWHRLIVEADGCARKVVGYAPFDDPPGRHPCGFGQDRREWQPCDQWRHLPVHETELTESASLIATLIANPSLTRDRPPASLAARWGRVSPGRGRTAPKPDGVFATLGGGPGASR
jgi:hypothetical protein